MIQNEGYEGPQEQQPKTLHSGFKIKNMHTKKKLTPRMSQEFQLKRRYERKCIIKIEDETNSENLNEDENEFNPVTMASTTKPSDAHMNTPMTMKKAINNLSGYTSNKKLFVQGLSETKQKFKIASGVLTTSRKVIQTTDFKNFRTSADMLVSPAGEESGGPTPII